MLVSTTPRILSHESMMARNKDEDVQGTESTIHSLNQRLQVFNSAPFQPIHLTCFLTIATAPKVHEYYSIKTHLLCEITGVNMISLKLNRNN